MDLQIGVKTLGEIEKLIDLNCWKALFWIHSLLSIQLQYLFYYRNQIKNIGHKKVDLILNKNGIATAEIKLDDVEEHKRKWKKVEDRLRYMDTAIDICYSRSLIDEEFEALKQFNSFRNKKVGHPSLKEHLPPDSDVQKMCKRGLKIVKSLDKKINDALNES